MLDKLIILTTSFVVISNLITIKVHPVININIYYIINIIIYLCNINIY